MMLEKLIDARNVESEIFSFVIGLINRSRTEVSFASKVESNVSCYFVCFVQVVDHSCAGRKTIHELHETHEIRRILPVV